MRRRVDILINDLRTRAAVLCATEESIQQGYSTDYQLMHEAANRLQAIEVLEKELDEAHNLIDELRDKIISLS